jgi:hypothetical protein
MPHAKADPARCRDEGDQWEVEAEWPDGTLERIIIFNAPSSATDWISTRSEAWLEVRNFRIGQQIPRTDL